VRRSLQVGLCGNSPVVARNRCRWTRYSRRCLRRSRKRSVNS